MALQGYCLECLWAGAMLVPKVGCLSPHWAGCKQHGMSLCQAWRLLSHQCTTTAVLSRQCMCLQYAAHMPYPLTHRVTRAGGEHSVQIGPYCPDIVSLVLPRGAGMESDTRGSNAFTRRMYEHQEPPGPCACWHYMQRCPLAGLLGPPAAQGRALKLTPPTSHACADFYTGLVLLREHTRHANLKATASRHARRGLGMQSWQCAPMVQWGGHGQQGCTPYMTATCGRGNGSL